MDIKKSFYGEVHGVNHHWWVLAATSIGSFLTTYDFGAIGMSLPHIMKSFHANLALTSWVLLAQQFTATALLLPAGRLGDIVGKKKIYNLGFVIFIIGAFFCGLAQNLTQLISYRVFQAVGSSMLQTNSFAIVAAVFPERDRGKGMGTSSALVNIGTTAGPALGGLIIGMLGWRWVFFITLPIGVLGTILAYLILQEHKISTPPGKVVGNFDVLGSCISTIAVGALLAGLSLGQLRGWYSQGTIFLLITALLALLVFLVIEPRRAHPLVDMNMLKNRSFALNNISRFTLFVTASSNLLLMPFYLQVVLGYSPAETGMLLAPMSILLGALAPVSGWLTNIISTRILSAFGMGLLGLGLYSTSQLGLTSNYHDVLWRLLLIGGGYGIFQTPNNTAIMDSVTRDKFGLASGFMALVREFGRAMGTSMASIIVVSSMFATVGTISLYGLKGGAGSTIQGPALQAFAEGISTALLTASLLCIPGIIFCLLRGKSARDEGKLT